MSAAFDTVDHDTLIRCLHVSYGLCGLALNRFRSYLQDRIQHVQFAGTKSSVSFVLFGVPQGSVLGPILFLLYTADLCHLVNSHGLQVHLYANDTQLYDACCPAETTELQTRLSVCLDDVASWMSANRLQLNPAKTELLCCSSLRRTVQPPSDRVMISGSDIRPASVVRDLGVWINSGVTMSTHISKVVASCFAILRQLCSIHRSLTRATLTRLVVSLVLTRLDYCNSILTGLPLSQLNRLQAVINAEAHFILSGRQRDHITPLLMQLHWLRVPERIEYKLCMLVYRCLHGMAPEYPARSFQCISNIMTRRHLLSAATYPPSAA